MTTPRPLACWGWCRPCRSVRFRLAMLPVVLVCLIVAAPAVAQFDGEESNSASDPTVPGPQVGGPQLGFPPAGTDSPSASSGSRGTATTTDDDLDSKLDRTGSIAMKKGTLGDWLFAIKQEWGINIVFSSSELEKETASGAFDDRPLREVLEAVLSTRGFGYERIGNSLRIVPEDQLGTLKPQFKDRIFPLKYVEPEDVVASIEILLSPGGRVTPINSSRTLYVIDLPERLARVGDVLSRLEENARQSAEAEAARQRPREERGRLSEQGPLEGLPAPESSVEMEGETVGVYPLQFINSTELLETLIQVLGSSDAQITELAAENKIVVLAPPSTIRSVTELIRRLDVPRPQVFITALLYDVNTEEMERLGFNWSKSGQGRFNAEGDPQSLLALNSTNFRDAVTTPDPEDAMAVISNPIGGFIRLQHFSRHFNLDTVLQAFSQLDGARLLARPNVMAYDGVQAVFRSVSEIPVQQLTETQQGGSIGTTTFREAGISLTVTPHINDDGSLRLDVLPEFSVLAGFQDGQPIIDRRTASTTVHMLDGSTVVIGGLLRRIELETQRGVPGLKRLKYFGPLFRDHDSSVTESELIVFVRAEIVGLQSPLKPRNQIAADVLDEASARIPVATPHPLLPHCGDPYCPIHCPAPRWFEGMLYESQPHGTFHHGDIKYGEFYETGPLSDQQLGPSDPAVLPEPTGDSQFQYWAPPNPPPGNTGPSTAPPVSNPLPPDAPPAIPAGPPPVIIDQTRFMPPQRVHPAQLIRRLPHVPQERPQVAAAGVPYILLPSAPVTPRPHRLAAESGVGWRAMEAIRGPQAAQTHRVVRQPVEKRGSLGDFIR